MKKIAMACLCAMLVGVFVVAGQPRAQAVVTAADRMYLNVNQQAMIQRLTNEWTAANAKYQSFSGN